MRFLDIINSLHNKLKFTVEAENNNMISFLNINLIRDDDKSIIDIYHKPSFSGRYLSSIPIILWTIRRDHIIWDMVDKIIPKLSHAKFYEKNFINMIIFYWIIDIFSTIFLLMSKIDSKYFFTMGFRREWELVVEGERGFGCDWRTKILFAVP